MLTFSAMLLSERRASSSCMLPAVTRLPLQMSPHHTSDTKSSLHHRPGGLDGSPRRQPKRGFATLAKAESASTTFPLADFFYLMRTCGLHQPASAYDIGSALVQRSDPCCDGVGCIESSFSASQVRRPDCGAVRCLPWGMDMIVLA